MHVRFLEKLCPLLELKDPTDFTQVFYNILQSMLLFCSLYTIAFRIPTLTILLLLQTVNYGNQLCEHPAAANGVEQTPCCGLLPPYSWRSLAGVKGRRRIRKGEGEERKAETTRGVELFLYTCSSVHFGEWNALFLFSIHIISLAFDSLSFPLASRPLFLGSLPSFMPRPLT
ncbi:hypothetical protein C8J55DRAFT_252664 [Lentinula edodes]|uniref:Uncharacterized protein n=1 Tax=Lentinula lateritia TaxID=40482 RepID=A0A9W9DZ33_9AGAR|nr:hypothetical protein C8J55DRAFT_252664 [Lentinula edodes]